MSRPTHTKNRGKTASPASVGRTKKQKQTRPDEWYFIKGETLCGPVVAIMGVVLGLDEKDWPQPSPFEVAKIAATMQGGDERDKAKRAVELIWAGALAAKEARDAAVEFKQYCERGRDKAEQLAALLGFDPDSLEYPLPYAAFLKLLNLGPVKLGNRHGVEGRELWHEFLRREFLAKRVSNDGNSVARLPVTKAAVREWEERHEREGLKESLSAMFYARRFFFWRAELVKENKLNPAFRKNIGRGKKV